MPGGGGGMPGAGGGDPMAGMSPEDQAMLMQVLQQLGISPQAAEAKAAEKLAAMRAKKASVNNSKAKAEKKAKFTRTMLDLFGRKS